MRFDRLPIRVTSALCALVVLAALTLPTGTFGKPAPKSSRQPVSALGSLVQLPGPSGCLVDRSKPARGARGSARCVARLRFSAPTRSRSVLTVATSTSRPPTSHAIAIFTRNARTGALSQRPGTAGCIAARGREWLRSGGRPRGPNSVAVSPDGKNVYATSVGSNAVVSFRRNPSTGALTQLGRRRLHRERRHAGLHHRPGARRSRRRHGQSRRRERLRGGVHRQLASRCSPATPRPVLSPSRPMPPAASSRPRPPAAPRAWPWAIPKAWRSAPTARTCTWPRRAATPSTRSLATPPPAR